MVSYIGSSLQSWDGLFAEPFSHRKNHIQKLCATFCHVTLFSHEQIIDTYIL